MIKIDGSMGEGGGQVLRSSLTLSMITQKPFVITNIRAGRKKTGLLRQHLAALNASAQICDAEVTGNELGSSSLSFKPGKIKPGRYRIAVGSAGSCSLVLQTVIPALLFAQEESEILVEGGTHVSWSPPFDFLETTYGACLKQMRARVYFELIAYGFYPAGGGKIKVRVKPAKLSPVNWSNSELRVSGASVYFSNIAFDICTREKEVLSRKLGLKVEEILTNQVESIGPGNVIVVQTSGGAVDVMISDSGRLGVSAERIAGNLAKNVLSYLNSGASADEHLADQLLLLNALAGNGSFTTTKPSRHLITNKEVILCFLDCEISIHKISDSVWEVGCVRGKEN